MSLSGQPLRWNVALLEVPGNTFYPDDDTVLDESGHEKWENAGATAMESTDGNFRLEVGIESHRYRLHIITREHGEAFREFSLEGGDRTFDFQMHRKTNE